MINYFLTILEMTIPCTRTMNPSFLEYCEPLGVTQKYFQHQSSLAISNIYLWVHCNKQVLWLDVTSSSWRLSAPSGNCQWMHFLKLHGITSSVCIKIDTWVDYWLTSSTYCLCPEWIVLCNVVDSIINHLSLDLIYMHTQFIWKLGLSPTQSSMMHLQALSWS
jgi:hypothetical protein